MSRGLLPSSQKSSMLEKIASPKDIKNLTTEELGQLAAEIRQKIIQTVEKNGGHLSSNLGTVELILALHRAFDAPKDKLIFDVGHQCYAHKIITGRAERFDTLRQFGGISGFSDPSESEYDAIYAGHSSTSLSQALGMCRARDLKGEKYHVVAVIGDGALSGGMAFEALNDIGNSDTRLIIVLNDNEMSISKNVGGVSRHLCRLRLSRSYINIKKGLRRFIFALPLVGKPIRKICEFFKRQAVKLVIAGNIFDSLGVKYVGAFDGHNICELTRAFERAKQLDGPVLLHILTKKGKGYTPAEESPDIYHGIRKGFKNGNTAFSARAGDKLCELAEQDDRIVAVTAAMKEGTGLVRFSERFTKRFFDVGICEQHAVTMCAGMAAVGFKPYFCVYSTFLQRAFDQISNDVCLPDLPVTLLVDRAGLVGRDGETHHGIFDVPYLSCLPNITIYTPKDLADLEAILDFSKGFGHPLAVRYENEYFGEFDVHGEIIPGKWEVLSEGAEVNIIAYGGRMLNVAKKAMEILKEKGLDIGIINAAFIKPFDTGLLENLKGACFVLEQCPPSGGLYGALCGYACERGLPLRIYPLSLPDSYITFGSCEQLLESLGLSAEGVAKRILSKLVKDNGK